MTSDSRPDFRIPGARVSTVLRAGVALSVATLGDATRPPVLLVHGYPDTKEVWRDVATRLAAHFHVVTYDVRGAGDSARPSDLAAYDLRELKADMLAVIDATCGDRPVHLVGHDWGSIQSWELVTDRIAQHRLASFTCISGPCLDHVGMRLRDQLRSGSPREYLAVANQLRRSWYIAALSTPGLAARAWRGPVAERFAADLERDEGITPAIHPLAPTLARDGEYGAKLYERNIAARLRHPRPDAFTSVPVQLILPTHDRFVGAMLFDGLEKWAPNLERSRIDAGHWCVRTQPDQVAALIRAHAEGSAMSRGTQAA